jgi:hypothetical protein
MALLTGVDVFEAPQRAALRTEARGDRTQLLLVGEKAVSELRTFGGLPDTRQATPIVLSALPLP